MKDRQDQLGNAVGMAAKRADELVDSAAARAKDLGANTKNVVGGIIQKSAHNVFEGLEKNVLEGLPEWKEALEGLHKNLESTVQDHLGRFHGLEAFEESDDDGYEIMEGEAGNEAMRCSPCKANALPVS